MRNRGLWIAAALLTLAFLSFQALSDRIVFSLFLARDLERARLWLAGRPFLAGPELTGGGYLPGPFYYLLLSPVAAAMDALKLSWRAIPAYLSAFTAAAVVLCWAWTRRRWGAPAAMLSAAVLVSSENLGKMTLRIYNPSFLPLFCLAAIFGLLEVFCFQDEARRRARVWLLTCLILGLSMQLHLSVLPLAAGAIALQLLARRLGLKPLSRAELALGAVVFLAPMAPYAIWSLFQATEPGVALPTQPIGGSASLLLAPIQDNWRRLISLEFARKGGALFLADSPVGVGCAVALPVLVALGSIRRRNASGRDTPPSVLALRALLILFALNFALTYGISFFGRARNRYFVVTHLLFNLVLAAGTARLLLSRARELGGLRLARWAGIALSWTAAAFVATWALSDHSIRVQGVRGARARDLDSALSAIRSETGWSFRELQERLVAMDLGLHSDLSIHYEDLVRRIPAPDPSWRPGPDGYFLFVARDRLQDSPPWKIRDWLKQRPNPPELLEALDTERIGIGRPRQFGSLAILPYRVFDTESLPRRFGNLGFAYREAPGESLLPADPAARATGVRELADGRLLFHWSSCPGSECAFGIAVAVSGTALEAELIGAPLSEPHWIYRPAWSQELRDVFVELECDGRTHRRSIARAAGLPTFTEDSLDGTATFLAPLRREFALPCRVPPVAVRAGFGGSRAISHGRAVTLPGSTLSWRASAPQAPASPPRRAPDPAASRGSRE